MAHPRPFYTPDQLARFAAKQLEREIAETKQIAEIGAAATRLASIRRMKLGPMNEHKLWAEFDFYTALEAWDADGRFVDTIDDICSSLRIDRDGNEVAA